MSDTTPEMLEHFALASTRKGRGRPSVRNPLAVIRELGEEDIAMLEAVPQAPLPQRQISRIRATHHAAAMAVASGAPTAQVALISGYEPSYIPTLMKSPLFAELVDYYRSQHGDLFKDVAARTAALGMSFMDEIQHRLEESPEGFSNEDIRKWAMDLLGPTVLPPKVQQGGARGGGGAGFGSAPPAGFRIEFVDSQHAKTTVEVTPIEERALPPVLDLKPREE